jgi:hypothetical protein
MNRDALPVIVVILSHKKNWYVFRTPKWLHKLSRRNMKWPTGRKQPNAHNGCTKVTKPSVGQPQYANLLLIHATAPWSSKKEPWTINYLTMNQYISMWQNKENQEADIPVVWATNMFMSSVRNQALNSPKRAMDIYRKIQKMYVPSHTLQVTRSG